MALSFRRRTRELHDMVVPPETIVGDVLYVERQTHDRGSVLMIASDVETSVREIGAIAFTDRKLVFAGKHFLKKSKVSMKLADIEDVEHTGNGRRQRVAVTSTRSRESFAATWRSRKQFEQFCHALRDAAAKARERSD